MTNNDSSRVHVTVRAIEPQDRREWSELFEQYREFCGRTPAPNIVNTVWQWLSDSNHAVRGLVAVATDASGESQVAGIAHLRSFPRTVDANHGLHLDDLYVSNKFRGEGVAHRLLEAIGEIASSSRAEFVRWVTASDNDRAQKLYDGVATRTHWVTYEQTPA